VLLDFFVQMSNVFANDRGWILRDHLLERLLVICQMERYILRSLGLDQALDTIEKVLCQRERRVTIIRCTFRRLKWFLDTKNVFKSLLPGASVVIS
jgi:hypothetical protein